MFTCTTRVRPTGVRSSSSRSALRGFLRPLGRACRRRHRHRPRSPVRPWPRWHTRRPSRDRLFFMPGSGRVCRLSIPVPAPRSGPRRRRRHPRPAGVSAPPIPCRPMTGRTPSPPPGMRPLARVFYRHACKSLAVPTRPGPRAPRLSSDSPVPPVHSRRGVTVAVARRRPRDRPRPPSQPTAAWPRHHPRPRPPPPWPRTCACHRPRWPRRRMWLRHRPRGCPPRRRGWTRHRPDSPPGAWRMSIPPGGAASPRRRRVSPGGLLSMGRRASTAATAAAASMWRHWSIGSFSSRRSRRRWRPA